MRIEERLSLVEDMISENPNRLSIAIPTATLAILVNRCRDREAVKQSELKWRTRANVYEESYISAKAGIKRLKAELKRYAHTETQTAAATASN